MITCMIKQVLNSNPFVLRIQSHTLYRKSYIRVELLRFQTQSVDKGAI